MASQPFGFSRSLLAFVIATVVTIGSAGATTANTDLSDIWWNPSESGWGMQIVNTGTFAYATIYVYGADGKPVWYGGGMTKTADDPVTYVGDLYAATGPYFGGAFDPAAVKVRQVGIMTFALLTVRTATFTYSVDGVAVDKSVQRQPLTLDDYSGNYSTGFTQTTTGCSNTANNGIVTGTGTANIVQNGASVAVTMTTSAGSCVVNGTYTQLGRMGRVSGPYSCGSGEIGNAVLFEMSSAPYMFTARLQNTSTNLGCTTDGELTGLIPR